MSSPTLSFIIPAYNAENSLEKLIDSIYNQNNHNISFEIIIVNDGSTDKTKQIIDNLLLIKKEIISFDTENQGVYKSRNFALSKIKGNYLWMLDADDYIEKNALYIIENTIKKNKSDVINFGYNIEEQKNIFKKKFTQKNDNSIIEGIDFLKQNNGRLYLWNNIYSIKFLNKYKLRFLAKSVSLEDSLFNINVFLKAKKVFLLDQVLYTYAFEESSISRKKDLKHLIKKGTSSFNVQHNLKSIRDKNSNNKKIYNILNERLSHSVLGFFYSLIQERYPFYYVKEMYGLYRKKQLLPTKSNNPTFKILVFQRIVNIKYLYFLSCRINLFVNR